MQIETNENERPIVTQLGGDPSCRPSQKLTVFWIRASEPLSLALIEEVGMDPPILYKTREQAERDCQQYNHMFDDPEQAYVIEIEVK
jgi:hypothetical protein